MAVPPSESTSPDEFTKDLRLVIRIIRNALSDELTALTPYDDLFPTSFALAGLSHCCVLLDNLDEVRLRGDDLVAALIGRAHLETWLTAAWVYLGRESALDKLRGSYAQAVRVNDEALVSSMARATARYEKALLSRGKVEQVNEAIRKDNAKTARSKSPLRVAPLPRPPMIVEVDLAAHRANAGQVSEAEVTFETMAEQIGPMAEEAGIGGGNWEVVYNLAYRALSTWGAHPSYWVLDQYFDRDHPQMLVRTTVPSEGRAEAVTRTAVGLTAMLAAEVLEPLGVGATELRALDARMRAEAS